MTEATTPVYRSTLQRCGWYDNGKYLMFWGAVLIFVGSSLYVSTIGYYAMLALLVFTCGGMAVYWGIWVRPKLFEMFGVGQTLVAAALVIVIYHWWGEDTARCATTAFAGVVLFFTGWRMVHLAKKPRG